MLEEQVVKSHDIIPFLPPLLPLAGSLWPSTSSPSSFVSSLLDISSLVRNTTWSTYQESELEAVYPSEQTITKYYSHVCSPPPPPRQPTYDYIWTPRPSASRRWGQADSGRRCHCETRPAPPPPGPAIEYTRLVPIQCCSHTILNLQASTSYFYYQL